MPGAPAPTYLPEPFANEAPAQYRNAIPDAPPASPQNAASWQQGFPSVTMQSELAGGLPPLGQDFNGVLFTLSSHTYAQQAGQLYTFNATFSGAAGGYKAGAVLGMADGSGAWLNTQDGNGANPDAGGAGWVPAFSYGITYVNGLTGGTITLTPAQARRNVIVLNGALAGNLTVIFPATQQSWLLVNNTTGAFTTTAKTAAGTGVTVPQGGPSSPLGVWGDGANLYPTVAPLGVPISQSAQPLTLVERTNGGFVFATYFNQSSPWNEDPAVGSVYVQNTGHDGYGRWCDLSNFLSQCPVSSLAGQVSAAQVPYSAVSQWAANLFNSPAFTGAPTAPTQGAGDNSTKLANTAFVQGALANFFGGRSIAGNGYYTLPGGLILQWGLFGPFTNGTFRVNFPTPFPNGVFMVNGSNTLAPNGTGGAGNWEQYITEQDASGFYLFSTGVSSSGVWAPWFAIGY